MHPTPLRRLTLTASGLLLALLVGCSSQELYSQLSERQANEMVAVLRSAGIDAEKKAHEGKFSVLTAKGDFSLAVRTLNAQGYPRESFDSMGKVFKREGFVSSPLEERARLMHAMSQEISNTIANIDGVVTARVHLVVPERNPLIDKPQPAAAAVFIKHRTDRDLSSQITQIKALVVNSIEGLSYDNVTVALFPAEAMPTDARRPLAQTAQQAQPLQQAQHASLDMPLTIGGGAGALALAGGLALWWRRRSSPQVVTPTPLRALPAAAPAANRTRDLAADLKAALLRRGEGRS
ncbi:MAG TPA: type III secretion inner membrane ring lipoprotein SctJ [Burkholderiaceae bacterium]|nr:type III secretion inner membrane ring lipoprotein SctJ [Burkholderiaceae bacterium]